MSGLRDDKVGQSIRMPDRGEAGGNRLDPSAPVRVLRDEERVVDPVTGGAKGKKLAEMGSLPPMSLMEVAKVAGFGTQKYARFNYMKGYDWSLSSDAMERHLLLWKSGQSFDVESGLHHLAHAAWHCLALIAFEQYQLGKDDRWIAPRKLNGGRDLRPGEGCDDGGGTVDGHGTAGPGSTDSPVPNGGYCRVCCGYHPGSLGRTWESGGCQRPEPSVVPTGGAIGSFDGVRYFGGARQAEAGSGLDGPGSYSRSDPEGVK
jgi:hypothetical protein